MTSTAKPSSVRYELWLRLGCTERDCEGWTFVPARSLPEFVVCVMCRKRIPTKTVPMMEWRRRGTNG